MKPSRGLKTPLAIICRSERVLASRGTRGSPRASLTSSPRSSTGALRSTRIPPCGAMVLLSTSIFLLSQRFSRSMNCWPGGSGNSVGGELVVVGQAVLIRLSRLVRKNRVPALGPLDAGALLRRLVPPVPVVPPAHLPRLPRQGAWIECDAKVLAVGGEYARGVL